MKEKLLILGAMVALCCSCAGNSVLLDTESELNGLNNEKEMDKVINQLVERGLMATPTIIINDRLVYVTNSYEELSRLLEYEL